MDKILLFTYIFGLLIAILVVWLILIHNKIQFSLIKIKEAEDNLNISLNKKFELIKRMTKTVNDFTKGKHDDLKDILTLEQEEHTTFELDTKLDKAQVIILDYLDNNTKLSKKDTVIEVKDDLYNCNVDLMASKKYYNENVVVYNTFIKSFPSNIICFFLKLKEKDFYSEEKEEIFDILKEN